MGSDLRQQRFSNGVWLILSVAVALLSWWWLSSNRYYDYAQSDGWVVLLKVMVAMCAMTGLVFGILSSVVFMIRAVYTEIRHRHRGDTVS